VKDYVVKFDRSLYVIVSAENAHAAQDLVARGDYDSRDEIVTMPSWDEQATVAEGEEPDVPTRGVGGLTVSDQILLDGAQRRDSRVSSLSEADLAILAADTNPPIARFDGVRRGRLT
jgi:hypothetical protein